MELPENKLFLSIGELAEYLGETTATLRHWEDQFEILHPGTTQKGTRRYSRDDVKAAELIQFLLRTQGYTIEGAKKHIRRSHGKSIANKDVRDTLLEIRKKLYDIRAELGQLKSE